MSQRARTLALRVHERLAFERPPVSPSLLVAYAPIDVVMMDWPVELAGVLLLRQGRVVIGLNEQHSPGSRHFSFWHEVGHYLLHGKAARCGVACAGAPWERSYGHEQEADAFATTVLMPRHWVADSISQTRDVAVLARRFMVSRVAMARRLRELGLTQPGTPKRALGGSDTG